MIETLKNSTVETFLAPRSVASKLLDLKLSRATIMKLLVLASCLSAFVFALDRSALPMEIFGETPPWFLKYPSLFAAVMLTVSAFASSFGILVVGGFFGGKARFDDILIINAWTQWLQFLVQICVLLVAVLMPPMAGALNLFTFFLMIWINVNMVAVAHGFDGFLKSMVVVLLGGVMIFALVYTAILVLAGVS